MFGYSQRFQPNPPSYSRAGNGRKASAGSAPLRVLLICGSLNQTTQMHAIAKRLPKEWDAWFTPYYGAPHTHVLRALGLLEATIGGHKLRNICLDYLSSHGLQIDVNGERSPYDLVFTCSDLLVPWHHYKTPIILVQEGMTDDPNPLLPLVQRFPHALPRWIASTSATGLSDLYQRFCVASQGYRDLFEERGVRAEKMVVTGIPNFDDANRFEARSFPYRDYVLACTSDIREVGMGTEDRRATIEQARAIADGRLLIFKLHPNEERKRALAEIRRWAPEAIVYTEGRVEPMIANCSVLVTKFSSVVFIGLAMGKKVYSDFPTEQLRRLLPLQNGGRSAARIAEVACDLMGVMTPAETLVEARAAERISASLSSTW